MIGKTATRVARFLRHSLFAPASSTARGASAAGGPRSQRRAPRIKAYGAPGPRREYLAVDGMSSWRGRPTAARGRRRSSRPRRPSSRTTGSIELSGAGVLERFDLRPTEAASSRVSRAQASAREIRDAEAPRHLVETEHERRSRRNGACSYRPPQSPRRCNGASQRARIYWPEALRQRAAEGHAGAQADRYGSPGAFPNPAERRTSRSCCRPAASPALRQPWRAVLQRFRSTTSPRRKRTPGADGLKIPAPTRGSADSAPSTSAQCWTRSPSPASASRPAHRLTFGGGRGHTSTVIFSGNGFHYFSVSTNCRDSSVQGGGT